MSTGQSLMSTGQELTGSYDYFLVTLSVVIAVLAAYAALDFAVRVTSARGTARARWLVGGATVMGIGIWSMHYVGMLAFRLPIPVRYDWPTVLLSLLAAILASAVALFIVSREQMGVLRALLGSLLMGGGIAAMHYIGMVAMRLDALHSYSTSLVALSVVLAVVISLVALWLTFNLRSDASPWGLRKISSALVMGAAIPVMHYTGMAAATFTRAAPGQHHHEDLSHAVNVSSLSISGIIVVTVIVLGIVPLAGLKIDSLSNTRRLSVRYFIFLGAISVLAILGALLVRHEGEQSRSDARVINIAGRQRMLSQAIIKEALLLARDTKVAELGQRVARLREFDELWEHSHTALRQGDLSLGLPGNNSPDVERMFDTLEADYTSLERAIHALLDKVSATGTTTGTSAELNAILALDHGYLKTMNDIVFQYDREATDRHDRKNQLHFALLLSVLALMLVQGIVVLRPALDRIQQGITQLRSAKYALHRKARFVELLQTIAVAANEAPSVEEALQFAIERICQHTGWPVGHVYFAASEPTPGLVPSPLWHFDSAARFEAFREITSKTSFAVGVGLPGRVMASGKATWIANIELDTNFPRKDVSLQLGVRAAFGFPVLVRGKLVAVLEFFSRRVEEPDEELLTVMTHVGAQLGQVVERERAQQDIARKADELARSNAELEQFAYVASHDLQEPLRMVASYTQLLARRYKGKLDATADEFIGFAVDGATRMQTLIQDLLSYSRLTAKGQVLKLTDAGSACETARRHLKGSIEESRAQVTVDGLPDVLSYGAQLTQLFQNLIGNAIKYCSDHRPEVHVSARPNGEQWLFSVQDNGIGIEPQYFERIFQMFQRLHTREKFSGTGIGLAICRKIVERHGGRIWVESHPGQGSNFLFTLPRIKETQ